MSHRRRIRTKRSSKTALVSVVLSLVSGWAQAAESKPSKPYCGLYRVHGAPRAIGKEVLFEKLSRPGHVLSRDGSSILVAVQASALARGLNIARGCFGAAGRQPLGGESLATTSVLLVGSLGAFFVHSIVARGVKGGSPAADRPD